MKKSEHALPKCEVDGKSEVCTRQASKSLLILRPSLDHERKTRERSEGLPRLPKYWSVALVHTHLDREAHICFSTPGYLLPWPKTLVVL